MKYQLTARIFSFLVIFSMLMSALGMPNIVARADTPVTLDNTLGSTPTVDSAPATGIANNTNKITISSYTTGSGNNRLLMVGVSWSSTTVTVSSVTFGGTALTSVGTSYYSGQARRVAIWRLISPAASTTADVVVNFSGAVYGVAGVVSFAGVDQCTPLGTFLGATGNTNTATVSPVTVVGDLVFDTAAAGTALTVNGSQAQQWSTGDGTNIYGGASTKTATTTSTTMSWTLTSGYWATGGVAIKPVNPAPKTNTASSGTTVSVCQTTGTGTNRLMLVGVSLNANTTSTSISSITYTPVGGSAISLSPVIWDQNPWLYRYTGIYSLVIPPSVSSGQGGTVLVTLSATISSGAVVVGAANFAGVDTITPLGPAKSGDGVSGSTAVTLTGLVGDELVFDNLFLGGTSTSATAGAGQTQVPGWNAFLSNARGTASTEQATGSSVMMDWSLGGTYIWSDAAVPIIPSCTGTRYTLTADVDSNGTGVTLNPPGGSYCAGRIVTLTPVPNSGYLFNSWSGANASDVISNSGVYRIVMNGDKSITANFATSSCRDVTLDAVTDTYLSGAAATTNYGSSTSLQVAGTTTAANQRTALLKWDVSSIPSNATISSASIILNVTAPSTFAYPLYDLAKAWVEGSATWNNYAGTSTWGTAGAALITGAIDRGNTNLWNSTGSFSGTTPFTATVPLLDPAGLNAVRRWVTGGSNNGVIIQDYTSSSSSTALVFDSREGTTSPKLKINYCLGTPPTYTVTFDPNGGTGSMSPQTASAPTDLTPNVFTRAGYTFNGWNTQTDGSGTAYADSASYAFAANATLYAQWTALPSHTVTFDPNGGTGTMAAQTTNVPTALTLNTFTRTGYTFSGWNTQADGGGTAYADGATYAFNADINLYAQWTAPNHTVTFDANGGTGTMSPEIHNVATALMLNTFTRTGYSFSGWNTIDVGGGTAYADGATYDFTADITLYAQWTAPNHTVTFDANGGTGSMSPEIHNVATALTTNTFTRTGYTFSGWNTQADGGGTAYADGAIYSFAADISLYAQWTAPNQTVTFDPNGGTGSMSPQTANVPTALTLNTFTRRGYTFSGWNTQADGGGTAYADGATYDFTADITLYAQWTALPPHIVDFYANGGTGTMHHEVSNYPRTLTTNTFTRTGYTFSGWNTQADGGGTAYADRAIYDFTANIHLYAQWTALPSHTVNFDANGGTGSMSPEIYNVATALTTNTFTKTGYSFSGWNTLADGGGTAYDDGATYSFAADISLYAQWTALPTHTVTFDANGGTGSMSPETANVPTALTLNTFTRTGYSFSGWNTIDVGGGTAYADGASYDFAADIGLYAQWTALPPTCYALSLSKTGNGSIPVADPLKSEACSTNGQYVAGESITLTAIPDPGWQINSWSGTNGPLSNILTMPAEAHEASVIYTDIIPPDLTITGATADGVPMTGSLSGGYVLNTANNPTVNHQIQFASGTVASEALESTYFALYLTDSTMSHVALKGYYSARGVPAPYLTYLNGAVDGTNPFVYIKGNGTTAVSLVDAAQHDILSSDVAMTVPDDYPRGTYTVQGEIRDLANNPTSVTLKLIVAGHRTVAVSNDYDGDGLTDPAKFVNGIGAAWWLKSSTVSWQGLWMGGETFSYYGTSDFDGDGKIDPAKYIPSTGTLWWLKSTTGTWDGWWLGSGPLQYISGSDFDGDGQSDVAMFYPETGVIWWINSSTGTIEGKWLGPETMNYVSGSDFDGDGKSDPAKFVPSTNVLWYLGSKTGTWTGVYMGSETFTYVPASDFDGDGKTDPAKFISETGVLWYLSSKTSSWVGIPLGTGTYTYVPGCDFNGDGRTDPAKYDESTHTLSWYNVDTETWNDFYMGAEAFTIANGQ